METITIFGLGTMGRPMARLLHAAGYNVCGWNRSPLPPDLLGDIALAPSLEHAAEADVCLLMLSNSDAVDAVLDQIEPHLHAGQLVLDMSSCEPARSQAHAARLAQRGIGWIDAPVSGGPEGAAAGSLAIMAGGSEVDFSRAQPILNVLGGNLVHVGGPGMGHTVKLINQVIVALTIEAVAEALTLAERSGVDARLAQQALRGGFADSKILQIHGTRMIERAYVPGGSAALQLKDLHAALALARASGVTLPHLASVAARYEQLLAQGDGQLDHSALHKLLWDEGA